MSKNNNVNQNAIQIVFPSDMELRKVKKKRKRNLLMKVRRKS